MSDVYTSSDAHGASARPMTSQNLTSQMIRDAWDRSARAIQEERQTAALNQRFILNRHWSYWNRGSGRLEELPRNPERVRATIARIGPDSNRLIAKLTQNELTFEVAPQSPDDAAIHAAKVSEAAIAQVADDQAWEDIRYDHAFTTWIGGVGGVCVDWDSNIGTPVTESEEGAPIATGDCVLTPLSIHEMAFEPGTRNAEKATWWIRGMAIPPAEAQQHYNLPDLPKADARAVDTVWRMSEGERSNNVPLTMVLVYYERPTLGKPGRIATVVGDQLIDARPWDFPFDDRLNICMSIVQPVHGRWYGHTPVTDAVPVQAALNASWSSIIEHMKQAGNARLWVPMGSVDDLADLSDMPGEAAEYVPVNGQRPTFESPPAMPDWWIRQPAMLGDAMDDILGQHDVSRGQAPTGVESGIALSILAENDDTPVGRFGKNLGLMWGRVASIVLEVYQARVKESRNAIISMPDADIPELIEWNGDTLKGHTTAKVPTDAHSTRGRSAQAAFAMQLFDRGLIQSVGEFAKVADLPNQSDIMAATDPDTARALRENAFLSSGKARTVDVIDDHANHIHHHRNFVRSQRYERLDPKIQSLVRLHIVAHELYAADQAAKQAMAASVSPIAAALPTEATQPLDSENLGEASTLAALAPSAATGELGADLPPELLAMLGPEMQGGTPPQAQEVLEEPSAPAESPMGAPPAPQQSQTGPLPAPQEG